MNKQEKNTYLLTAAMSGFVAMPAVVSQAALAQSNHQQIDAPFNPILKNPPVKNPLPKNPFPKNPPVKNPPVKNPPVKNPHAKNPHFSVRVQVSNRVAPSKSSQYAIRCLQLFASKVTARGLERVQPQEVRAAEWCLKNFARSLR